MQSHVHILYMTLRLNRTRVTLTTAHGSMCVLKVTHPPHIRSPCLMTHGSSSMFRGLCALSGDSSAEINE